MRLWKKTVLLMLVTLLLALGLVGGLTLYVSWERSMANAGETYGKQLLASARMLEQFWDEEKYGNMTETGRKSYRNFQFRLCCGQGYALLKENRAVENLTEFEVLDTKGLKAEVQENSYDYGIQRLGKRYLLLQKTALSRPAGYQVFSAADVTAVYKEIKGLAFWYAGIYTVIFLLAGGFICQMMRRTVRTMENLQDVAERQELLLGALAHEMKTPLTSIIGYSETLLHVKLTEEQKLRALTHIHREGSRLEALSGKMLELMGLYGNRAISMEEHFAAELVQRVEETESEICLEKGLWLQTEYENFSMKMDIALMESLVLNLIDNARRASAPGGRIFFRAKYRENKRIFQVEDFGRGIPKEELQRVTEAFYMVDKSRSRSAGGAGLGLALCKKIAELHHGEIHIQSREGRGTIVTVSFPG